MLIALVVVAALVLAGAAAVVALRSRARADRYAAALERLESELQPISQRIRSSVERSQPAGAEADDLDPRLEELLERIAADGSAVVAFRQLAGEVAPEVVSSRRRLHRDSGGYELELEREIARARRTGRPLSLVLVDVDQPTADRLLQFAALLTRVTRVTDTVCRRRRDAFGILLPETGEDGARVFFRRVRDEAARTFDSGAGTTFSTGIVELKPNETGESLDARARAAVAGRVPGEVAADAPRRR
jgi:outer membrane murein-binding lipoprotein Lpp